MHWLQWYEIWYGIYHGIEYGIDLRRIQTVTSKNQTSGNTENPYLPGKYNDNIDCLPKGWNEPIVIPNMLYDGDGLESIFKSWLFSNPIFQG